MAVSYFILSPLQPKKSSLTLGSLRSRKNDHRIIERVQRKATRWIIESDMEYKERLRTLQITVPQTNFAKNPTCQR